MTDETTLTSPAAPEPMTPEPMTAPPPPPPLAPAKPPSRFRVAIPLIVILGFLGVVLYMTRDSLSADDLAVGTCFDIPTESSVSTVTRHECTVSHDAEVFHNAEYPSQDTYPITLSFDNFASDTCKPVFATYVGEEYDVSTDLEVGFFYPTSDSWSDGDRTITCYIYRADRAKITQSLKSSAGS